MKNGTLSHGRHALLTVILLAALLFSCAGASFAWLFDALVPDGNGDFSASSIVAYFAGGDGKSAQTAYLITEPRHLYNLAWLQNNGVFNTPTYFALGGPIDMAGAINGTDVTSGAIPPIGTTAAPFIGFFNGNGNVISNLWVSTEMEDWKERPEGTAGYTSNHVGLFGAVGNGAVVENFILDRVEVKSGINATVGIICGYVDAKVADVGVYNGIITVEAGISCQSKYSLLGELSPAVTWTDMPSISVSGGGTGGDGTGDSGGGELVLDPNYADDPFDDVAAGSATPVPGSIENTAYYVGELGYASKSGGNTVRMWDMRDGTPRAFTETTSKHPEIWRAYQDYNGSGMYKRALSAVTAPTVDENKIVTDTVEVMTENGLAHVPARSVWFKPSGYGVAALAFTQSNKSKPRYMAVYKYERVDATTLRQISETRFVLPGSINNGDIVYYEYEITKDDVLAKYEYAIGLASNYENSDKLEAGFLMMVLAGTDVDSGGVGGGNGGNGEGTVDTTRIVCDVDYVTSTSVDVTAQEYKNHETLLCINAATTTAAGRLYYKAVVDGDGVSRVHYYLPAVGLTVTDMATAAASPNTKISVSDANTNLYAPRDDTE